MMIYRGTDAHDNAIIVVYSLYNRNRQIVLRTRSSSLCKSCEVPLYNIQRLKRLFHSGEGVSTTVCIFSVEILLLSFHCHCANNYTAQYYVLV